VNETKSWGVALGTDGEVLGVEQGAPVAWVGARLAERAGVPAPLREAARAVVTAALRGEGAIARARVDVPELDATVELCAAPAISLRRTTTDVRALLRHAVAALERQARALDVGLGVTAAEDVPVAIFVDPEKIAWAISALVGNSMRYVRRGTRQMPGGSIAVTARRERAADAVVIVVEDDGPGIPPEVEARLFHRALAHDQGSAPKPPSALFATGVALTVVRDIVAAHGGSLSLASRTGPLDHGTTVTVTLPAG
jgi:signal transduction histidine kinase